MELQPLLVVAGLVALVIVGLVVVGSFGRPAAVPDLPPDPDEDEIRRLVELIRSAVLRLGDHGNWLDERAGRQLYDELLASPLPLFRAAVTRSLSASSWMDHRVFILVVKLGRGGTEYTLADALFHTGSSRLATDMLNSGRPIMVDSAQRWARQNNYRILTTGAVPSATWGVF